MERQLKVLWVDDDILQVQTTYGETLANALRAKGILLRIRPWSQGIGVPEILEEDPDIEFIIGDINLSSQEARCRTGYSDPEELSHKVYGQVWPVLERLRKEGLSRPVVIVSQFVGSIVESKEFVEELSCHSSMYIGAFPKTRQGICEAGELIYSYIQHPPVTSVVMSDLHIDGSGHSPEEFERTQNAIANEMKLIRSRYSPDHLLVLGDFVSNGQATAVSSVVETIRSIKTGLAMERPGWLHFCPGNHDVEQGGPQPWQPVYGAFVRQVAELDRSIVSRYEDRFGKVRSFHGVSDVLALGKGSRAGVSFASLSTVHPERGLNHNPEIGIEQMLALKMLVEQSVGSEGELRIALMHHSLYAAPTSSNVPEASIVVDSARVLRDLHALGFRIVLSGHSHYSCLHEHTLHPLNCGIDAPRKIRALSVAAFGGDPAPATPFQQYCILRIGHRSTEPQSRRSHRTLEVYTRTFRHETNDYHDGDKVIQSISD